MEFCNFKNYNQLIKFDPDWQKFSFKFFKTNLYYLLQACHGLIQFSIHFLKALTGMAFSANRFQLVFAAPLKVGCSAKLSNVSFAISTRRHHKSKSWDESDIETLHTQNFDQFIRNVENFCYLSEANTIILKNIFF